MSPLTKLELYLTDYYIDRVFSRAASTGSYPLLQSLEKLLRRGLEKTTHQKGKVVASLVATDLEIYKEFKLLGTEDKSEESNIDPSTITKTITHPRFKDI